MGRKAVSDVIMESDVIRSTDVNLFGTFISVKNYLCAKNGCPYEEKKKPVKLQLSVCPTSYCGAACPFCSARMLPHGGTAEKKFIDTAKLEKVIRELHDRDMIRGVSLTGGEPFTEVELLNEIIEMVFDICGIETEISINTNGSGLGKLDRIKRLAFVDTIHISRHHYDDARNEAYFKTRVATSGEIKGIVDIVKDRKLFVYNCLLLKDGIGTYEEMVKFLEFAAETGVPKVGFVTPMAVNDYTRENRVSYTTLFEQGHGSEGLLYTVGYEDFEFCHCRDGVYAASNGSLVEFYGRETLPVRCGYARGLVYGADNVLRTGFGEDAEVVMY